MSTEAAEATLAAGPKAAPEARPWMLPIFILLSLGAHIATFIIFQVTYPQRVTVPPPVATVMMLTPSSPEAEALLRWSAAEDPALAATSARAEPELPVQPAYRPSYAQRRTPPRTVGDTLKPLPYPPGRDTVALVRGAQAEPPAPEAAGTPSKTSVRFSGDLAARADGVFLPPVTLGGRSNSQKAATTEAVLSTQPVDAATYLIAVERSGKVKFVFPQESSGNDALDAWGRQEIAKMVFAAAEGEAESTVWGVATITWGDDAYGSSEERKEASGQ